MPGRYVAIGALAGGALGAFVAFTLTHQAYVTDHSEDGLAYMIFVPGGAAAGALMGAVVGAVRTR